MWVFVEIHFPQLQAQASAHKKFISDHWYGIDERYIIVYMPIPSINAKYVVISEYILNINTYCEWYLGTIGSID